MLRQISRQNMTEKRSSLLASLLIYIPHLLFTVPFSPSSPASPPSHPPSTTAPRPQHPRTPAPLLPPSPSGSYPHYCYLALVPRCGPRCRSPSPQQRGPVPATNGSTPSPLGTGLPSRVRRGRTGSSPTFRSRHHTPRRHSARR